MIIKSVNIIRKLISTLALLAVWSTVLVDRATGQTTGTIPVPDVNCVADNNGVNLSNGKYPLQGETISIGSGSSGLSFQRNWEDIDEDSWGHRFYSNIEISGGVGVRHYRTAMISLPDGSAQFRYPEMVPFKKDGSTLTENNLGFVYTAPDGTVTNFNKSHGFYGGDAVSTTQPDGERLTYHYKAAIGGPRLNRVQSVTSSKGYHLKLGYLNASSTVLISAMLIITSVDYCSPVADTCSGLTQAWPKLNYTSSAASGGSSTNEERNLVGGGRQFSITLFPAATPGSPNVTELDIRELTAVRRIGDLRDVYSIGYKFVSQSAHPGTTNGSAERVVGKSKVQKFDRDGASWTYSISLLRTPASLRTTNATVTDPLGAATFIRATNASDPYQLEESGLIYDYKDGLFRTTSFVYSDNKISAKVFPEEGQVDVAYGARGNPVTITTKAKPGSGSLDLVVSGVYPSTCANPLTCNKPTTVTDPNGQITNYTYDPAHGGILTETLPPVTSGQAPPQKRYTYAQQFAWIRNGVNSLVQAESPIWLLTQISECRTGSAPACVGTADETRTTYVYGSPNTPNNLLQTSTTIAAGDGSVSSTTSYTYDNWGNKLTEDGPLPGPVDVTRYRYDLLRRVVGVISPDSDSAGPLPHTAVRNIYNLTGNLVRVERGTVISQSDADWTAFSAIEAGETDYDILDRKVRERKMVDGVMLTLVQYSYDLAGRLECTAARMNPTIFASPPTSACVLGPEGTQGPDRITRNVYDAAGQLLQVRKAVGTPLEQAYATYAYSPNGKRTAVVDANGNRADLGYDGFDRQDRWTFPGQAALSATQRTSFTAATPAAALAMSLPSNAADYEQYAYDANGNRTSLRKRDGSVLSYQYDALNRNIVRIVPERSGTPASATRDVYYGYDLRGLQTSARFDSAAGEGVSNSYDALGRLKSSTINMDGNVRTLTYDHDANGNRIRLTYPDGQSFGFGYDGLDRMTGIDVGPVAGTGGLISRLSSQAQEGRQKPLAKF